jgi:hypothetical protein
LCVSTEACNGEHDRTLRLGTNLELGSCLNVILRIRPSGVWLCFSPGNEHFSWGVAQDPQGEELRLTAGGSSGAPRPLVDVLDCNVGREKPANDDLSVRWSRYGVDNGQPPRLDPGDLTSSREALRTGSLELDEIPPPSMG